MRRVIQTIAITGWLSVVGATTFGADAHGVEPAPSPVAYASYSKPENLFVSADDLSQTRIELQRDAYLRERGWELGFSRKNPGEAYLGWGSASITLRSTQQFRKVAGVVALITPG